MIRDWLSDNLAIDATRKEEVYLGICNSVALRDVSYWVEVLFSAGIATLGLVLNSPAVIIGAMLISPLMASILGNGLALAAGDVILAMRAILKLALSCMVAIFFAVALVYVLPFKEMTPEILARTKPNILDLVVALFSGAVGSVAICKPPKGVVTSIPGVAIAVALMPPLCVVGYGIGIAISVNMMNGFRIARGGGLLFFTNLVAITFTAMIVFLALHIDSVRAKQSIREWRRKHRESNWVKNILELLPESERVKKIGSLPGRFLLIVITILSILFPLNQSFSQLKQEIASKQQENIFTSAARDIWESEFASFNNGEQRSFISQISTRKRKHKLAVQLHVFTSELYTPGEQNYFIELLANKLGKPPELLSLNLIEIPTASNELLRTVNQEEVAEVVISIAQIESNFLKEIKSALLDLDLPPHARMIDYELISRPDKPMMVRLLYLSERNIDEDAQILLVNDIKRRLSYSSARVEMKRIAVKPEIINFKDESATLTEENFKQIDKIASILQQQPALKIKIISNQKQEEPENTVQKRKKAIQQHLQVKWKIEKERIIEENGTESQTTTLLKII